ncbi:deoxynucleotide monophosphate kinase family protein [Posidoniimonas corsicana]|uniref:deoxynucleotide monophosphate kinase family protein n=1 Tax=Posidoniimonas corsicana TaxID=1938618 RepID=UPI0036F38360
MRLDNGAHAKLARIVGTFGWDHAKRHADVRRLLQGLGTDVVRDVCGADVWVDLMRRRLNETRRRGPVVITDVRFANEIALLRGDFGGRLIRIERPGVGPVNGHVSDQTGGLPTDGEVLNDGSPEQLCRRVLDCVQTFWEADQAAEGAA